MPFLLLLIKTPLWKSRSLTILFFLIFSSSTFAFEPTPNQLKKEEVTKRVYKDLVKAIGNGRQAPLLVFSFNKTEYENYNTYYSPKRQTIIVGEGIYNLAVSLGADSLNALALVLGHELAHFYKDHGWGMAFGSSADDLKIAKEIYDTELSLDRKKIMEAEADYFGSLFGYLAGYNTLKIGDKFISAFYDVGVPEVSPGYPDKNDRIKIVQEVETKLSSLVPVFEAANLLSIIGKHEESARCYQHIATTFPSREIYNNAGVNLATYALSLFEGEKEPDYFYPFGFDEDSRLNRTGTKGNEDESKEQLIEESINCFEKAIHIDKSYTPGYINLALVYDLIGDNEMGLLMATKAARMAKESKDTFLIANSHIAKGINQDHSGNSKEAKSSFSNAVNGNKKIAELNLSVLKNGKPYHALINKNSTNEILIEEQESINEVDPSLVEVLKDDSEMIQLKSQNKERRKMKIYSYNKEGIKTIYVKHYTSPMSESKFVITPENFEGSSLRGIQINHEISEVFKKYGTPSKISTGIKGNYFVYKQTPIIFRTDKDNRITNWILY